MALVGRGESSLKVALSKSQSSVDYPNSAVNTPTTRKIKKPSSEKVFVLVFIYSVTCQKFNIFLIC